MKECDFCKITNKEKKCFLIYESDNLMSFLDIDPINEGHVLIIPKIHRSSIDEIPLFILNEMIKLSQKIVSALTQIYKVDGYSIMQNGGEFCEYGHFHLHIFPRYRNDGFAWTYPQEAGRYSLNIAQKISRNLK